MDLLEAEGCATEPGQTCFVAPPGVVRVELGGRPLLFSETGQQLAELNPTADLIWRRLASGEPPPEVADALTELGAEPQQALRFVADCLTGWLAGGQLLPTCALEQLAAPPTALRHFALDELEVTLAFHGEAHPDDADAVFGHLAVGAVADPRRLSVVGAGGLSYLFLDGCPRGGFDGEGLVPALKATLTELYAQSVREGFLAHGALLARNGRAVFLSGEPGAGKTTLTLALAAAGFAYGGDDIVRIAPDGRAHAAPFAAAVKSGAWGLVAEFAPEIADLPVRLRADGQRVRYHLPQLRAGAEPRPFDAILLLDRREGAAPVLEPVHPVEGLTTILASSYSPRGALEAAALEGLAASLERAAVHRLVYSDLEAATALVRGLVDG